MANFYYGNDESQSYWLNLDHVCFVKPESDKLILKTIDGNVFKVDGEDFHALKQLLWHETVNWEEEYKENHKRHNQEDIPPPSDFSDNEDKHTKKVTSQYCSNEDYGWIPINWDVVEYLLENYRLDWEGTTPDLDSLYESLKEAYNSYLRMYFPDFAELRQQSEF